MLRFWRDFYLILIRSFPGSFGVQAHPRRWYTARLLFCVKNISHVFWWVKKDGDVPLLRWLKIQKTPEMNDLDCASKSLKSGAPNFEKQKNESEWKKKTFFFQNLIAAGAPPLKRFQSDSCSLNIRNRVHKISLQKKSEILIYLVPLKKIIAILPV